MRRILRNAIGAICPYCGNVMDGTARRPTRDHAHTPKCRRGTLIGSNKVIVCHWCNVNKGSRTLAQWHEKLVNARDPRARCVERLLGLRT